MGLNQWEQAYQRGEPNLSVAAIGNNPFILKDTGKRVDGKVVYTLPAVNEGNAAGIEWVGIPSRIGSRGNTEGAFIGQKLVGNQVIDVSYAGGQQSIFTTRENIINPKANVTYEQLQTTQQNERYFMPNTPFSFSSGTSPSSIERLKAIGKIPSSKESYARINPTTGEKTSSILTQSNTTKLTQGIQLQQGMQIGLSNSLLATQTSGKIEIMPYRQIPQSKKNPEPFGYYAQPFPTNVVSTGTIGGTRTIRGEWGDKTSSTKLGYFSGTLKALSVSVQESKGGKLVNKIIGEKSILGNILSTSHKKTSENFNQQVQKWENIKSKAQVINPKDSLFTQAIKVNVYKSGTKIMDTGVFAGKVIQEWSSRYTKPINVGIDVGIGFGFGKVFQLTTKPISAIKNIPLRSLTTGSITGALATPYVITKGIQLGQVKNENQFASFIGSTGYELSTFSLGMKGAYISSKTGKTENIINTLSKIKPSETKVNILTARETLPAFKEYAQKIKITPEGKIIESGKTPITIYKTSVEKYRGFIGTFETKANTKFTTKELFNAVNKPLQITRPPDRTNLIKTEEGSTFITRTIELGKNTFYIRSNINALGSGTTKIFKGDILLKSYAQKGKPTLRIGEEQFGFKASKVNSLIDFRQDLNKQVGLFRGYATNLNQEFISFARGKISKAEILKARALDQKTIITGKPKFTLTKAGTKEEIDITGIQKIGTKYEWIKGFTKPKKQVSKLSKEGEFKVSIPTRTLVTEKYKTNVDFTIGYTPKGEYFSKFIKADIKPVSKKLSASELEQLKINEMFKSKGTKKIALVQGKKGSTITKLESTTEKVSIPSTILKGVTKSFRLKNVRIYTQQMQAKSLGQIYTVLPFPVSTGKRISSTSNINSVISQNLSNSLSSNLQNKSILTNKEISISVNKLVSKNFQTSSTKQTSIGKLTETKFTPNPIIDIGFGGTTNIFITEIPPPSSMIPFRFSIGGGMPDYYSRKKNVRKVSLKTKYNPSVKAGLFNIRGKIPSSFSISSGLGVRPITKSFAREKVGNTFSF